MGDTCEKESADGQFCPLPRAARLRSASSLLLVFLLGLIAPFAGLVVRAQSAEPTLARKTARYTAGPRSTYIIYDSGDGNVSCRDATPAEVAAIASGGKEVGLRQINHLEELPSAAPEVDGGTPNSPTGLTIILRGTAQLEANPAAKQAFINAAAKWEAIITSPITIVIDVDYGETHFGTAFSSANILGATSTQNVFFENNGYNLLRGKLIALASSPEESALYNALPQNGLPTDLGVSTTPLMATPIMRALGLAPPDANPATEPPAFKDVPKIGFNSKFPFDFNPNDGISPTQTDFDAVAVHEIGHALGFDSEVGARELQPTRRLFVSVWDLFRFRPGTASQATFSTAQRILSSGGEHVEVNDFPDTELYLSTGKPDGTGGDEEQSSHWKDDAQSPFIFFGIMDPNIRRGRREVITENDRKAIDRMGYRTVGAVEIPPPANDNFGSAKAVTGATGSDSVNTVSATKEPGEPSHGGFFGGKSAWYRWTATGTGTATFDTLNSGFDTLLAVYTGNTLGGLSHVASNDDINTGGGIVASRVQFNAFAGTTYFIALDGFNETFEDPVPNPAAADSGISFLNWSVPFAAPAPAPGNDNIASAVALSGNAGSVNGTNVGATREAAEPSHSPDGNAGGASVWYRLTSPGNGPLTINTAGSNFNTLLGVYTPNSSGALGVGNLLRVAKNNDSSDTTSSVTFSAVAGLVYYIAVDGSGGATGNGLRLNWNFAGSASVPTVQFSQINYGLPESGGPTAIVTVTRTGDLSAPATVDMSTNVPGFQANCGVGNGGAANPRCDYANFGGTVRFAPGVDSRNVFIPIVDDTYAEGNETIAVSLSNARGATLGSPATANVSILDNDSASATSPIDEVAFFVKQQYYDFLSREPDGTGFAGWQATINGCPGGGFGLANPQCDRVRASAGFFQSEEFQGRGYFAYRFYQVAFGRRPTFAEFIPDLLKVGGPQSPADGEASRAEFVEAFVLRPEFTAKYSQPQFQSSQAYVNELERTAQVTLNATFKASLVAALDNGTKTRDVVLQDIANTAEVQNRHFNEAFVTMQYFGYQRRDPDAASATWVTELNQTGDYRRMIFNFIFSEEYRVRFGLK